MAPMTGNVFTNNYNADGRIMVEVTLKKQPLQNLRYAVDECGSGAWSLFTDHGEWRCPAETHVEVTQFRDIRQNERLGEIESKLAAITSVSLSDIGDDAEPDATPATSAADALTTAVMDAELFSADNAPKNAPESDSVQVSTNTGSVYWQDPTTPKQVDMFGDSIPTKVNPEDFLS